MRVALVNPPWDYRHSIYFGCRSPHLPLELAYAKALLERAGHTAALIDAHALDLDREEAARTVEAFRASMTVDTTSRKDMILIDFRFFVPMFTSKRKRI